MSTITTTTAGPAIRDRFERVTATASGALLRLGVLALAFAAVLLAWPAPTVTVMLWLFAGFLAADGVASIAAATRAASPSRGWLAARGAIAVVAASVVVAWPGITALALLYTIGAWAIAGGVAELATLHRTSLPDASRFAVGLGGTMSIVLGLVMFASPGDGAIALLTLVAATAVVKGVMLIAAGVKVRAVGREMQTIAR
jgi:uncharacterized membrane protein HdeD (DUF308 family)